MEFPLQFAKDVAVFFLVIILNENESFPLFYRAIAEQFKIVDLKNKE